jgi:hypothetical protein
MEYMESVLHASPSHSLEVLLEASDAIKRDLMAIGKATENPWVLELHLW